MVKAPTKDDGLTPTQRRNARKRRSKQKESKTSYRKRQHDVDQNRGDNNDPSQRFIKNPRNCPVAKAAKLFFEQSRRIEFPIMIGKSVGWRTVAKLAVRNVDGQLRLGLFAPKSHTLIPASCSPAHHKSINAAILCVETTTSQFGITAYDESSGTGLLRHVIFSVETTTARVQATMVVRGSECSTKKMLGDFALCLAKEKPTLWHSIWFHSNDSWKHANNIIAIGGEFHRLYFSNDVKTTCPFGGITESPQKGTPLHFPPSVFRQANLHAFQSIVKTIQVYLKDEIKNRPVCLELYGGVGTIGLNLASLCSEIISSDENPHNVTCFNKSVEVMQSRTKEKLSLRYVAASAEAMVHQGALAKANLVVVDPPRKGLDLVVARALGEAKHIDCLVYVSCGFPAFERDCAILEQGGFKLHKAEGHILFPGSDAIETLAFFRR